MIEQSLASIATSLAVIASRMSSNIPQQGNAIPSTPQPTPDTAPAESKAAEKAAKKAADPAAKKPAEAKPAAAPVKDYEPLKGAVVALANHSGEGKAAAINLLSKYGVKKAGEIPSEKWDEAQVAFESELALLNGADDNFA